MAVCLLSDDICRTQAVATQAGASGYRVSVATTGLFVSGLYHARSLRIRDVSRPARPGRPQ